LTERGIDFESVRYLEMPLSQDDLKQLLRRAGLKPHDVLRKKEPAYQDHVAGKNLTDEEMIRVMTRYPEIIQRPIVVRGKKAVLARPLEKLNELDI
jgi:arsenate reductase (glutaredoxin)